MADCPIDSFFDVIGNSDDLPDAFFDALAGLLLDTSEPDESQQDAEENSCVSSKLPANVNEVKQPAADWLEYA